MKKPGKLSPCLFRFAGDDDDEAVKAELASCSFIY
jgi:hypothetical protein